MKLVSRAWGKCRADVPADTAETLLTHPRKWGRSKPAIAASIATLVAFAVAISWTLWKGKLLPEKVGITN